MESSRKKPSTEDLLASIGAVLSIYCRPGDRLAIAFSGGLDSSVLLHILSRNASHWGFAPPVAIHVNHGLSPHADSWSEHCADVCKAWNVSLETKRVIVDLGNGDGTEAAAREARYRALREVVADWIMLGHHQDDQAETMLLNLIRGAGLVGMGGMRFARERYLRPMLDVPRALIRAYAESMQIRWIEDESNSSESYTRNFFRHRVFPILGERFPSVSTNLVRSARLLHEGADLLDELARIDEGKPGRLSIDQLRNLAPPRALNLLSYKLREAGVRIPSRARLEELLRQLIQASRSSALRFVFGCHEVRRFGDQMHVLSHPLDRPSLQAWSGEQSLPWGRARIRFLSSPGEGVNAEVLRQSRVTFSCRRGGESLRLDPAAPMRRVKDLLREAGIPPWVRDRLPLMHIDGELVWVPGVGIAHEYRCKPQEMGISLEFDAPNW